jgi:hypothetical protein
VKQRHLEKRMNQEPTRESRQRWNGQPKHDGHMSGVVDADVWDWKAFPTAIRQGQLTPSTNDHWHW